MPFDPQPDETDVATPDLDSYSTIVVAFSGGKDSLACLLHLLDLGVPRERLELWHHDVDGQEGSDLMDWPVTRAYCRAIADAMGVPIYFSWKVGGFEREMLRDGTATAAIFYETPEGVRSSGGTSGKLGTRRRFPQVSADLSTRWCSAYLKIDVCAAAIRGQERFNGARTLVVTGERAEEGSVGKDGKPRGRAAYKALEPHRADRRGGRKSRHVDQWRPVHRWSEAQVWAIIERHRIDPHPAYKLGWGRVSCAACIFGSANQWASLAAIAPDRVERIARYEESFGVTIKRDKPVRLLAVVGQPYARTADTDIVQFAMSPTYHRPVILSEGDWSLPAGAFGESCGPT